jgi:hypothetical protein
MKLKKTGRAKVFRWEWRSGRRAKTRSGAEEEEKEA